MAYTLQTELLNLIRETTPFQHLSLSDLNQLLHHAKLIRYRIGQPILVREKMPQFLSIIYEGQARVLGYEAQSSTPISLQKVGKYEILGWVSLLRDIPSETVIASTEVICLSIPSSEFLNYLSTQPILQTFFQQPAVTEILEILSLDIQKQAKVVDHLKETVLAIQTKTRILSLSPGKHPSEQLISGYRWLISSGIVNELTIGSCLTPEETFLQVSGEKPARIIGFPLENYTLQSEKILPENIESHLADSVPSKGLEIIDAPEYPTELEPELHPNIKFPFVRGKGEIEAPLACFQMLSQWVGIKFKRDLIQRILEHQKSTAGMITLPACGAITEMLGFQSQLIKLPPDAVSRLSFPSLIPWGDSFAIIYQINGQINGQKITLASPEKGIRRLTVEEFINSWNQDKPNTPLSAITLKPPSQEAREKFSLRWFLPAIAQYKLPLIEVFIASFFVQLFGLANPLVTMVIVDKVISQGQFNTLDVLGIFLLGAAFLEAVLTGVRSYLFVDTTNRIDFKLGSEVIAHLLKLPLSYFDDRRVGELAGRVNELENIRQFLTGTALTVVLDAVFSVIYIAVMLYISPLLTLVALSTIPLFIILTAIASPIIRRQLRQKAEKYADTQSYLVEVLSGSQTVKAQNLELKSRWQWQERYARYIHSSFQGVLTSNIAGSISGFLNKLSGLLLLWIGAYLVLSQHISLGQLIGFRIIAGYVTSPLLRLVQLWQSFQETALSIERLADILDAEPEADSNNQQQIPLPKLQGAVKYQNVSFRFPSANTPQLMNVHLEFEPGTFVGIVGQSGSGKSTLSKLLMRLYEANEGLIQVDSYDITKVELSSLRQQIGVVLQDTLLFNATVQENIALTNPDATIEQIIQAAKTAAAHDFIMSLPNGYNTLVGERGSALSGGQRQRIAIARTVLQNPRLLVLDEATSALDYNSEQLVCQNLRENFRDRTVFFITHRLATVKKADMILVMDQGAVVEQGTHDELMGLKGRYYCLYQQQESQI